MVSWNSALKAAGLFVAYTIAWDIFGSVLVYVGVITFIYPTSVFASGIDPYKVALGLIVTVFGMMIMTIGNIASFFKINR
jgi:hypothetical protein